MLEIHPQLLLYQGAIFIIFVFLMWKFVYKSLVKMVEERRNKIENTMLEADKKKSEAEVLKHGYETKLTEINTKAEDIRRRSEAEAWQKHNEIVDAARSEASTIVERGRQQSTAEHEQVMLEAKSDILDISIELAKKALDKAFDQQVEEKLISELSEEIKKTEWKK
jgi:F-type H+-transporting ATPase subunit b